MIVATRRGLSALFGAGLSAVLSLLWLAAPDRMPPWRPVMTMTLPAARFTSPTGPVERDGDLLVLRHADRDGRSVLVADRLALDAGRYRYLRLNFDRLPVLLRPVLLWLDAGGTHRSAIPWHAGGGTIDLSRLDGWNGQIGTLAVLFTPLDAVPVPASLEREIRFAGAELASDNRVDALLALATELCAWRPWNGRSINTAGFELAQPPTVRVLAWLALVVAGGTLGYLLPRRQRPPLRWLLAGAAIALWLLLDLAQLRQLGWRATVAEAAFAGSPDGAPMTAQADLSAPVAALLDALARQPANTRVLVWSESPFLRRYLTFLLQPLDVAPLPTALALPADANARHAVLVLAGRGDWQTDPGAGRLQLGKRVVPATLLFEQPGLLSAWRLGATP